jgi:hypothetical protein
MVIQCIFANIDEPIILHYAGKSFKSSFRHIELHAPTSSTQKFKLMGNDGAIHLYSNTPPHVCRLPQAAYVDIGVGCNYFN